MARTERQKTKYPGIYYVMNKHGEKVYFARYRKQGKAVDEKIGRQFADDMTLPKQQASGQTECWAKT